MEKEGRMFFRNSVRNVLVLLRMTAMFGDEYRCAVLAVCCRVYKELCFDMIYNVVSWCRWCWQTEMNTLKLHAGEIYVLKYQMIFTKSSKYWHCKFNLKERITMSTLWSLYSLYLMADMAHKRTLRSHQLFAFCYCFISDFQFCCTDHMSDVW